MLSVLLHVRVCVAKYVNEVYYYTSYAFTQAGLRELARMVQIFERAV